MGRGSLPPERGTTIGLSTLNGGLGPSEERGVLFPPDGNLCQLFGSEVGWLCRSLCCCGSGAGEPFRAGGTVSIGIDLGADGLPSCPCPCCGNLCHSLLLPSGLGVCAGPSFCWPPFCWPPLPEEAPGLSIGMGLGVGLPDPLSAGVALGA